MVNSLSDVDILYNKSIPLNTNCKVVFSRHNTKKINECDRFRSRKPLKNPREVVIHKSQQRKVSNEINFQKFSKPKQVSSIESIRRKLQESFPRNRGLSPKFLSKSKFALSKRQSGSNFSLVVNLSKRRRPYPYRIKQKDFKNGCPHNFLIGDESKQRYLIIPLITNGFKNNKYHIYPFIMENWESDPQGQGKICSCSQPTQKKAPLSESYREKQVPDKVLGNPERVGDGFPDMYRQVLGPTPDESILAGLQTVIDMCSSVETKSIANPLGQTSSNQDIIEWVENQYSTLKQDSQTNQSHASLYNIRQRKETLEEIEKLVKKKSELDKEALTIKKEKSSSSKISTSESSEIETTSRGEEEEEEDISTSCSKIACSCGTEESVCLCDPLNPSLVQKCRCTQTVSLQKSKGTQQPSVTSTESSSDKSGDSSDDDKSSQTTRTTEECSKSTKTTSTKTTESSEESHESIQCSNKSVQACKPKSMSCKSVQTCKQLGFDCKPRTPPSSILTTPKRSLSPSPPEESGQSIQGLTKFLTDIPCVCKPPQNVNQIAMVCTQTIQKSSPSNTSPKSTQTEKSKSTSCRSSESTSGSSKISSGNKDCNCQTQSNINIKSLPGTGSILRSSSEENTGDEVLSVDYEKSNYSGRHKIPKDDKSFLSDKENPNNESEDVERTPSSKHVLKTRRSSTLEPVPEEPNSKSSFCKICSAKSSSVKLPTTCESEGTYHRLKISHFSCGNAPGRKQRPLRSEKSKEKQIEKEFPYKNEFSKKIQAVGDCFCETASPEVRYAMVRITKFEQYSTFEILDASIRKPKCFPATIETIFVVKNKTK